jgi:hypothetical protein
MKLLSAFQSLGIALLASLMTLVTLSPASAANVCTAGDPILINQPCTQDSDCSTTSGRCDSEADTCTPDSPANPGGLCSSDAECNIAGVCSPQDQTTCLNQIGSSCCSLTQGAYGAPNGVANAGGSCDDPKLGLILKAQCAGCDPFAGDPNATTLGIHGLRATTLDTRAVLIAYLPAGGSPGSFLPALVGPDTHYALPAQIPDRTGSGSKGQGGGVLAGQTLACQLTEFLSSCSPPFGGDARFTSTGFGGFTLPTAGTLLCTRRSGPDELPSTADDVCEAFAYPTCVAGLTVTAVRLLADTQLATGANPAGCSASELAGSLDQINSQFDHCGSVVACTDASGAAVTAIGVFECP